MADDKEQAGSEEELTPEELEAKAKKKKKLIIIVGAAVLLLCLLGGGAVMFMGGDKELAAKSVEGVDGEAAAPSEDGAAEGEVAAPDGETASTVTTAATPDSESSGEFGCTFSLKPFHLNLGNPLENRYLRLEMSIEHKCNEEIKAELEKRTAQLRDAVIGITSKKTREFLLGPDGKAQLRKEVVTRINHYMNTKVDDVFITDILIE
jgi:flagellar protein FliL